LYKQETNWSSVSALGKETRKGIFVIRFFKSNKHFTVYKSNNLNLLKVKALESAKLLDVNLKKLLKCSTWNIFCFTDSPLFATFFRMIYCHVF